MLNPYTMNKKYYGMKWIFCQAKQTLSDMFDNPTNEHCSPYAMRAGNSVVNALILYQSSIFSQIPPADADAFERVVLTCVLFQNQVRNRIQIPRTIDN